MINQTYYLIRHKKTKQFMPLMKRNRGYTHWNPSNGKPSLDIETKIPRLLVSEKQALQVIDLWYRLANARRHSVQTRDDDWNEYVLPKDDGRAKEDLEIVSISLVEIK